MGNGFSSRKRYINGKFPEKCWIDDVWPEVDDVFDKLNFDQKSGFEVFKVYARMDSADQNQIVDKEQIYSYYGGRRNKYNERIFYALHDDKAESPTKLSFVNFGILIWNYCTLRPSDLARHIFEIYDVDISGQLERPDLESMYKMMYDCDDHDEHCISQFPFDKDGVIKKWEFIDHSNRKRHLIKPAIDYQRRLRHRTGGLLMWEALTRYRVRTFAIHDSQSRTLQEALKVILAYDDPNRRRKRDADRMLAAQRKKLKEEAEKQEQELKELAEKEKAFAEQAVQHIEEDDWEMKSAWRLFEENKQSFDETLYTTDEVWDRREARLSLFVLLDEAIQISKAYWEAKDRKEFNFFAQGSTEDVEARYQDYIKSDEGELVYQKAYLTYVLKDLVDEIVASKAKRKQSEFDQSEKELKIRSALIEAERIDVKKKLSLGRKFLAEEEAVAKRYARKENLKTAAERTHKDISEKFQADNVAQTKASLAEAFAAREKEYAKADFDLCMNQGSRITKWEHVLSNEKGEAVYLNIDTLQILSEDTAICEKCDAIFEPHERNCPQCDAIRSLKNFKLYRPMKF